MLIIIESKMRKPMATAFFSSKIESIRNRAPVFSCIFPVSAV